MVAKLNIITAMNGVGLEYDTKIILEQLKPFKVDVKTFDFRYETAFRNADIQIFLETFKPEQLKYGKVNLFIPNPEWDYSNSGYDQLDLILCKTKDALQIYSELTNNCEYISFTSKDMYLQDVCKDYAIALHLQGKSNLKGTKQILEAYRNYPLPYLLWLSQLNEIVEIPERVQTNFTRLEDYDLALLMNMCGIHICPSEYEGFGHYINEAKSTGAIIITTDAAPMNELVSSDFGALVKSKPAHKKQKATLHNIDIIDLIEKYEAITYLTEDELHQKRYLARESYLANDRFFKAKFNEILRQYL